jgi:exodeoxyribonuclease V beta subunit
LVARRFAAEQARRAQMGFDDLLSRLDAALRATAGGNGQRLAGRIRRQFPVALIDEFQDTDPVQYRIFDAVHGLAGGADAGDGAASECSTASAPPCALILIGDPKQAIYAFRGADIHTYLAARKACAGRVHTLRRNFRSTPAMVAAVNHCFAVAEARVAGDGAFLFRRGADNPLPFVTAEARGRREAWRPDLASASEHAPALTVWWLPPHPDGKPLSKDDYRRQMAAACAGEMVRLLQRGQQGRAGFADAAEPDSSRSSHSFRPLRPADIAVLVNGRAEADAIRAALAQAGVRSVYLSDRESVFQSAEAVEVQHWLAACAEPGDARLLRAALATATLALPWSALERLNRDESAWEARVLQFRGYRDCWRRQGVLPMLRRLLNDFGVPARLLGPAGGGGGERVLTNILHLAELLQQASRLLDGEHALLRHLAEQRRETVAGGGDARQLRLESDADLVRVVTIHKAKGLEYPLVFLPFAGNYRPVDARDARPLRWHDAQGRPRLALSPDAEVLERADRERLGEDLRKLYVALTRARHATWLGLAPLPALEKSAFGHLLGGGAAIAPADLPAILRAWAAPCPAIAVEQAPAADAGRHVPASAATARGAARRSARVTREHWWIASYSALDVVGSGGDAGAGPRPAEAPESATADVFRETLAAVEPDAARPPAPASLHDFPRGAEAGTFLHEILEWVAGQGFAAAAADAPALREALSRRCEARGWQRWLAPLADWLPRFLRQPLPLPCAGEGSDRNPIGGAPPTVAFADLTATMAEMEFWLAVHAVDTVRIDALVRRHTLDGADRPALRDGQLNGMLKGFIDLVFEHRGRYYIADYKSNWLGPDDAAYTPAAMRAAILQSRYELQYVLYLLALHRLLESRLPDYDYDRHVGGAVYLFLRGSDAPSRGVHAERPPRALIAALDALFAGAGEAS